MDDQPTGNWSRQDRQSEQQSNMEITSDHGCQTGWSQSSSRPHWYLHETIGRERGPVLVSGHADDDSGSMEGITDMQESLEQDLQQTIGDPSVCQGMIYDETPRDVGTTYGRTPGQADPWISGCDRNVDVGDEAYPLPQPGQQQSDQSLTGEVPPLGVLYYEPDEGDVVVMMMGATPPSTTDTVVNNPGSHG